MAAVVERPVGTFVTGTFVAANGAGTSEVVPLQRGGRLRHAGMGPPADRGSFRGLIDVHPGGQRRPSTLIANGWMRAPSPLPSAPGGIIWNGNMPLTDDDPQIVFRVDNRTGADVVIFWQFVMEDI